MQIIKIILIIIFLSGSYYLSIDDNKYPERYGIDGFYNGKKAMLSILEINNGYIKFCNEINKKYLNKVKVFNEDYISYLYRPPTSKYHGKYKYNDGISLLFNSKEDLKFCLEAEKTGIKMTEPSIHKDIKYIDSSKCIAINDYYSFNIKNDVFFFCNKQDN